MKKLLLILTVLFVSYSMSAQSYGASGRNVPLKGRWIYYTSPSAYTSGDSLRLVFWKQLKDSCAAISARIGISGLTDSAYVNGINAGSTDSSIYVVTASGGVALFKALRKKGVFINCHALSDSTIACDIDSAALRTWVLTFASGGGGNALTYAATTDKTLSNTTSVTSLISTTGRGAIAIPANTLIVGSVIEIEGDGIISWNSGVSFTASFLNTSSNINTSGSSGSTYTAQRFHFKCKGTVRTTGASGTIAMSAAWIISNSNEAPIPDSFNSTINTTISQTFDFTWSFGTASTSNAITIYQATIKVY